MSSNPPTPLTPGGVVILVNILGLVRRSSLWKRLALTALICLSVWYMASVVVWPWTKLHVNKVHHQIDQIASYGDLFHRARGK